MKRITALAWTLSIGAAAACGGAETSSGGGETTTEGTAASALVDANASTILMYRNQDQADELPPLVPVVVTFKGTTPSAAFRLGCGANNGNLLEGFGYNADKDLDTLPLYDSLDLVKEYLRGLSNVADDVPMQTLRCNADSKEMRKQIVQVFRMVDADPTKDPLDPYLIRFKDDPGNVYTAGCLNVLEALQWTAEGGSDLANVSIPINRAVYDAWKAQGIQERTISCYTRTGRPLPAPNATLPPQKTDGDPPGPPELWKVREKFDGISSAMTLYLISDGKGYALDCGSNQDELLRAFGFDVDVKIRELDVNDPRFTGSSPHAQPILRCGASSASLFQSLDEDPSQNYFRFGDSPNVVRFTCAQTAGFFAANAAPPRKVPKQALSYLVPDPNAPDGPTPILRVGCTDAADDPMNAGKSAFVAVYGRAPTDAEAQAARTAYAGYKSKPGGTSASATVSLTADLEKTALGELGPVIERAYAAAAAKPNPNTDIDGFTIAGYLGDKVNGRFGAKIPANFSKLKAFIEERTPRLRAKVADHDLHTYGNWRDFAADSNFHRALMENPDDVSALASFLAKDTLAVIADAAKLDVVVTNCIGEGKGFNKTRPNFDNGTVWPEDKAFFKAEVTKSKADVAKTGLWQWVTGRVTYKKPAARDSVLWGYDAVLGCNRVTPVNKFGACPPDDGLAQWTARMYDPATNFDYGDAQRLAYENQTYLTDCMNDGTRKCAREVDAVVSRACAVLKKQCDASVRKTFVNSMKSHKTPVSYGMVECLLQKKPSCGWITPPSQ